MRVLTNVVSEIAHRLLEVLPSHKHILLPLVQVGRKKRGRILQQNRASATNVKTEEFQLGQDFLAMAENDVLLLKFIIAVSFPENLLEGSIKGKLSKFVDFMQKNQLDTSFSLDNAAIFR